MKFRGRRVFFVLAFMIIVVTSPAFAALSEREGLAIQAGHEALNKLYRDHEAGVLDDREYTRQLGFLVYAYDRLNPAYKPDRESAIKCGTIIVREFWENFNLLSAEDQAFFESSRARPTNQFFYDTPQGNFRVWYDTTGTHAIYQPTVDVNPADGVPDFVNRMAESLEFVWTEETTPGGSIGLDYDHPPFDGTIGGSTNRYDIYTQALQAGLYGYCQAEATGTGTYPGRTNSRTSFIVMHRSFWWAGADPVIPMQVTASHEFQHAVQFAYNVYADTAWMENCAVNMEELVYDVHNDYYTWINPRYQAPHKRIKEFDGQIEYATVIWAMFLTQRYHHTLVRNVWENHIMVQNTMDVWETTFQNNFGRSLPDMYQEFTSWFYLSGSLDDGRHYEEGAAWTSNLTNGHVRIERTHTTFPANGTTPTNAPDRLGCNFIDFDLSATTGYGLEITFDANVSTGITYGMTVMTYDQLLNLWSAKWYQADVNGHLVVTISDPTRQISRVGVSFQNLRPYGTGVGAYTYSANIITTPPDVVPSLSSVSIVLLLVLTGLMVAVSTRRSRGNLKVGNRN